MNRVKMMQASWMSHRKALLSLLDVIPDDQVDLKPWNGAASLGQLAIHAADGHFYRFVKSGQPAPRTPVEWKTMDDVRAIVSAETDSINDVFNSLTEEDLDKVLEFSPIGVTGPGSMFLMLAKEHEIHHKGQLFVYARMAGAPEVPFFVSRG